MLKRLFDYKGGSLLRSLARSVLAVLMLATVVGPAIGGALILVFETTVQLGQYVVTGSTGGEPNP